MLGGVQPRGLLLAGDLVRRTPLRPYVRNVLLGTGSSLSERSGSARVERSGMRTLPTPSAAPVDRPQGRAGSVSAGSRLSGMEGLRGLAAASIVVYHCYLYALDGRGTGVGPLDAALRHTSAGVLLFFTLSGLLLYRPFAEAIIGGHAFPSVRRYARNRGLRIFPAYWLVLLLTGLVLGAALLQSGSDGPTIGHLTDPGPLLANLALLQSYHPSTFLTGIGPAWSLVVEMAFYVALPIAAWLAHRLAVRHGARRTAIALLPPLGFLLLGLSGKLLARVVLDGSSGWSRSWGGVLARSFLANADLFSFGMVVAVASVLHANGTLRLPHRWRAVTIAVSLVLGITLIASGGELGVPRYDLLGAAASAVAVAALVLGPRPRHDAALRLLEAPAVVLVGLASYSLYLWHEPLLHLFVDRGLLGRAGVTGLLLAVPTVGVAAGLLATLTYRYVEKPALGFRSRSGAGRRAGHS